MTWGGAGPSAFIRFDTFQCCMQFGFILLLNTFFYIDRLYRALIRISQVWADPWQRSNL